MEQHPHSYENEQPAAEPIECGGAMPGGAEVPAATTAAEPSADAAVGTESPTETAESERKPPEPPSIYVASLADYNVGKLHGT